MEEELCCPICFESYDFNIRRPLMLPACGHTFCRACLLSGRFDTCPDDRSRFTDPATLPTNILALRSIESRATRIPGVDEEVKLIRSSDLQLEEKVGQGGSGEVWRGRYRSKVVAVKIFSSLDLQEPKSSTPYTTITTTTSSSGSSGGPGAVISIADQPLMRAFVKEVELLQVVSEDSMHCCRLVGCAIKDNKPCIVMKWFGNGHLQVPQGGYDLAGALQWGSAIAKALADVHALGIVVADLKPENVLISDQGDPVLADFGISRKVTHTMAALTQGRTSVTVQGIQGTPYYMAPEQWKAARLTNRTDIWSWGCLMLQLLTGSPPWLHLNVYQVMGMVGMEKATPKVPSGLPGWLAALLRSCFAYEPSARPSAADLVTVIKTNTTLLAAPGTQAEAGGNCVSGGVMPSYSPHVPDIAMHTPGSSSSRESTQQILDRMLKLFSLTQPVQPSGIGVSAGLGAQDAAARGAGSDVQPLPAAAPVGSPCQLVAVGWQPLQPASVPQVLEGHTDTVYCCAITPDGRTLVSGSYDKTLRLWDLVTGSCKRTLQGHTNWVLCCAITPDGRTLVSGSGDGTLRLWDLVTGSCKHTLQGHDSMVSCCAITPDGRTLVSGSWDNTLRLWDLVTGSCKHTLKGHTDTVYCCAITPNGRTLVSGSSDDTLRLWDLVTGSCKHMLQGHDGTVYCCAISPDGRTLVSGSSDETLRLWDLVTGSCKHTLEGHDDTVYCCAISPDGRTLVSGGCDEALRLWDLVTGSCKRTLQGHTGTVSCCAITPDGRTLVSGSWDETLRLYDLVLGR